MIDIAVQQQNDALLFTKA